MEANALVAATQDYDQAFNHGTFSNAASEFGDELTLRSINSYTSGAGEVDSDARPSALPTPTTPARNTEPTTRTAPSYPTSHKPDEPSHGQQQLSPHERFVDDVRSNWKNEFGQNRSPANEITETGRGNLLVSHTPLHAHAHAHTHTRTRAHPVIGHTLL